MESNETKWIKFSTKHLVIMHWAFSNQSFPNYKVEKHWNWCTDLHNIVLLKRALFQFHSKSLAHFCQMKKTAQFSNEVDVFYSRENNPWIVGNTVPRKQWNASGGILSQNKFYRMFIETMQEWTWVARRSGISLQGWQVLFSRISWAGRLWFGDVRSPWLEFPIKCRLT